MAPSSIPDRFDGAGDDAAIDEIAASIKERGQIVPGLIRPHKGNGLPYQIVFGRRRLAAAKALGLKFRAIVRELSDEEAIVFQGEENANRNDLSFIEKCAFALSQEQAGYRRRRDLRIACDGQVACVGDAADCNRDPPDVLFAIGSSPEIGRRRWIDFADAFARRQDGAARIKQSLGQDKAAAEKDRFAIVWRAEGRSGAGGRTACRDGNTSKWLSSSDSQLREDRPQAQLHKRPFRPVSLIS